MSKARLEVSASPHLFGPDTTPRIMWNVVFSLLPLLAMAVWHFGPSALLVISGATIGALLPELLFGDRGTLADGSALITGILLGLCLPAGLPIWMAFVGGFFGVGCGKLVFGGLGQNIFNPALLGRAFLQAAFPVAMTTYSVTGGPWWQLRGDNFALPLMSADPTDIISGATPLGLSKFEHTSTDLWSLVLGTTSGSLGETSGILILLCGGYLAARNFLNWRIPISIFASVALLSGILFLLDSARFPNPLFMLFSGGLMLGALYMATDMVTSPVTNLGCWIFGAGIGLLVVVIRMWGGLAECVMYAILLMNAVVPFINRATQPRVFGSTGLKVSS